MLKLSNIRLTEKLDIPALRKIAAGILGIAETEVNNLSIQKLSIDARKKPRVEFVYTLIAEVTNARTLTLKTNVSSYIQPEPYQFPQPRAAIKPVIVGTGPAGLFAALCLAEAGIKCVILERGKPVEERIRDISRFWLTGELDPDSNVQFGEGGAGTFSDGKLTTGISDPRVRYVFERLAEFGAPDEILYLAKPHVGTDNLRGVVKRIRERLIELGCDIRFGHRLVDIEVSNTQLQSITVEAGDARYSIETDKLILAPGNSARDTFEMLHKRGVQLLPKNFSVGVRIEHLQSEIDRSQYGTAPVGAIINRPRMTTTSRPRAADCRPYVSSHSIPASDYKLVTHLPNGRSVYTFCVCPGGYVVASSSEQSGVVTNGMSEFLRDGTNCNGAILAAVTPEDFGHAPLAGIEFQRKLEHAAFMAGGGNFHAPAQLVGDFLRRIPSTGAGKVSPTYRPGVRFCNLWDVLPELICEAIADALPDFARRVSAFGTPDAVLTAVESRSSCPVRIEREDCETVGIHGIFPCGEGAGYAGGIISAAVDGMRCAEAVNM
ncbi:MAG: FAD-binding protein [Oscillospiraceae bacterium]|nr:FAD-binding protein [Oscillospiraceae bacterium]